ncbi:MAG TPA: fumarylacetoacetate hydrolase family protein [Gaiellaceae bacterium]|nr:fumarylacetoacetate hydrolase family protein [Gaiellaceae bacterium]
MRFASVGVDGERRAAIVDGRKVALAASGSLDDLVRSGGEFSAGGREQDLADVRLDAPLRPPVLLCCGQNYTGHLAEQTRPRRGEAEFFVKAGVTIASPDEPLVYPHSHTGKLDYETELGVVVGRDMRDVDPDDALDYVFGYVVLNDLSARDRQFKSNGMSWPGTGKNFDGATRLGALIVPAADVPDPQALVVTTWVNGERRQLDTTANMVHSCAEVLSAFSRALTIPAGVIVGTGTPGGTALGCDGELGGTGATPEGCVAARYLEPGDTVVSEIEGVGSLEFDVVAG